jgi:hypothetical protein
LLFKPNIYIFGYSYNFKNKTIMKSGIEKTRENFQTQEYFTSEELWNYWIIRDPDLNRNTFYRRVNRLKNETGLTEILKNIYAFSDKPYFNPLKDNILRKIANIFKERFPEIDYCTWQTAWLHEFMIQQPGRHFIVFETEKDMVEQAFFLLKSPKWQVFLDADNTTIDYLSMEDKDIIVVKSMISRSPLLIQEKISIPALEKVLTDVFCDRKLFSPYTGRELSNIFKYARKKYTINHSRLLNYAARRNRKEEILDFILQAENDPLKEILNDIK